MRDFRRDFVGNSSQLNILGRSLLALTVTSRWRQCTLPIPPHILPIRDFHCTPLLDRGSLNIRSRRWTATSESLHVVPSPWFLRVAFLEPHIRATRS